MRKHHGNARVAAFHRIDQHVAAGLLDEPMHHRQSQPGAAADLLGGEERFEHPGQGGRVHAMAVVAHPQHHVLAWCCIREQGSVVVVEVAVVDLDHQPPAVRHRIAGIHRQVQYGGLQLADVDRHAPDVLGAADLQLHQLTQCTLQHVVHVQQALVEVGGLAVQRLASGKRQQALGQAGGTPDTLQRVVQRPADHRPGFPRALIQQHGVLDVAGDDRQDVVEIMRDAAGELADRLDLL